MAALTQIGKYVDTSLNEYEVDNDKIKEVKIKISKICSDLNLSRDNNDHRKKIIEILCQEFKDDKSLADIDLNEFFVNLIDEKGWVKQEKRTKTPRSFDKERSPSTTSFSSNGFNDNKVPIKGIRSYFKLTKIRWDDASGDNAYFVKLDRHFDGENNLKNMISLLNMV